MYFYLLRHPSPALGCSHRCYTCNSRCYSHRGYITIWKNSSCHHSFDHWHTRTWKNSDVGIHACPLTFLFCIIRVLNRRRCQKRKRILQLLLIDSVAYRTFLRHQTNIVVLLKIEIAFIWKIVLISVPVLSTSNTKTKTKTKS
jgi:hypothetical protein